MLQMTFIRVQNKNYIEKTQSTILQPVRSREAILACLNFVLITVKAKAELVFQPSTEIVIVSHFD